MFAVIFICGNLFFGSLEKSQKLEPAKISCHTVRPKCLGREALTEKIQSRFDTNSSSEIAQKFLSLQVKFAIEQEKHFVGVNILRSLSQVRETIDTSKELNLHRNDLISRRPVTPKQGTKKSRPIVRDK